VIITLTARETTGDAAVSTRAGQAVPSDRKLSVFSRGDVALCCCHRSVYRAYSLCVPRSIAWAPLLESLRCNTIDRPQVARRPMWAFRSLPVCWRSCCISWFCRYTHTFTLY